MELFKASNQWASRPDDERFWTIEEMIAQCFKYRHASAQASVIYRDLRVEAVDADLRMVGKAGVPAKLTHWSFGQLSQRAGAPPSYLRKLPPTLAAQNINHGLKSREEEDHARLLLSQTNGPDSWVLRAMTSDRYTRIWNHEVGERLLPLMAAGWTVPPAMAVAADDSRAREATVEDCGDHTYIREGDIIGPAGIYASDHDMFVFMINPERVVDNGSEKGLFRGFFVWNSEVGAQSFGVMSFLFDAVCGNHIVWGAQGVQELRIRHIGKADERAFAELSVELRKYSDSSASDIEAQIQSAQKMVLGVDKETVVDAVLGMARAKRIQVAQKTLVAAYDIATEHEDRYGDPNTMWAMVSGLTEASQELGYADKRVEADRTAGKLLELSF